MKSLITAGLLVTSLALTGNAAMAANATTHKYRHTPAAARVAQHLPQDQFGAGLGQFIQSMFGCGLPVRYARSSRSNLSSAASGGSESFNSPAAVDTSSNDEQAALNAQVQTQQALDSENALNASVAAAEAQNEAAQATAIQQMNANN
jgi:hypothetical protein